MVVGDGSRTIVVIVDGGVEVATCRVHGPAPPDLSVVEVVARLQLAARRRGWSIRLHDPCPQLCDLLDLVGLAGLLAVAGSALEARRETEGGEQLGVEEVMEPGDPLA